MRADAAWFQARDIIGKMASTCGEVSGASSVFCGAMFKQPMMGGHSFVILSRLIDCHLIALPLNPPHLLGDTLHIAHMPSVSRV